eukprot:CAMPEP_0117451260 /NCGR_PEP_ID=MMETSP0759-20121206/8912_1 /TAXON_ID=63605 /ORGANISM="Percolomonas cosmopolitus, Strain WS" /LENGTH=630 /DNA_ID=CAMNT_0005243847 /DNA_START=74 /DNA_END=1962 /DNA_ORIENTATION=+
MPHPSTVRIPQPQLISKILRDSFSIGSLFPMRVEATVQPHAAYERAKALQTPAASGVAATSLHASSAAFRPITTFQWKPKASQKQILTEKDKNTHDAVKEASWWDSLSSPLHTLLAPNQCQLQMSPLQSLIIPRLIDTRSDAIVQSAPNSGKTLTYVAPIVNECLMRLEHNNNSSQGTFKADGAVNHWPLDHVRRVPSVHNLILVSSLQNVSKVAQLCRSLLTEATGNATREEDDSAPVPRIVSFSSTSDQVNYNLLMGAPNADADILVATPQQVVNALKRQWIQTINTSSLVIDDANVLVQSANGNWENLVQVLRFMPRVEHNRKLVFGDYISEDMMTALRPYLNPQDEQIIMFKGDNDSWSNINFSLEKVDDDKRVDQLKSIVSNAKESVVIFANQPELLQKELSGAINLAASQEEVNTQVRENPQAKVFITNDANGVDQMAPILSNVSTVVSYDFNTLGDVIERSTILGTQESPASIVFYSSNTPSHLLETVPEFFKSIGQKIPSNFSESNLKEMSRLQEQEQRADVKLICEVVYGKELFESYYASLYGLDHLVEVLKSNPATAFTPEDWEWRHPEIYARHSRLLQKDSLQEVVKEAKEIDRSRRTYKKEKREKNRQIWLAKREKRR